MLEQNAKNNHGMRHGGNWGDIDIFVCVLGKKD